MPPNTDVDKLSTDELVKYLAEYTSLPVPKSDIKAMHKSNITGFSLVHSGTEKAFKEEGTSWGTSTNLIRFKEYYLRKKRTADEAELAPYESDKCLQVVFEEAQAESGEYQRAHVQEGSGDTTDTQKSIQRRDGYVAQHVKIAQQQAPELWRVSKLCKERRRQIIKFFDQKFKDSGDAKAKLSSPKISADLPFPFLGTRVPKRFIIRNDQGIFRYIGREVFSGILEAFNSGTQDGNLQDLWVYGLMGYGKSHLLAVLTCYLTAYGYRVIYLPDCRVCHERPVRYLQDALLFTWADSPEKTEEITQLRDMDEIESFITRTWSTSVIFVVDQLNALDGEDEARTKTQVRRWLDRCRSDMRTVLSTFANNISFHRTTLKQNNDYLFTVFGGFTRAEMDAWWSHHGNVDLGDYSRNEIEDYTGCNPLLLAGCTESGTVNFACDEILQMVRQSQRFAVRMKNTLNEWEWSQYKSFVKACIAGEIVPDDITPEHVDHRFFHEKNQVAYCVCGAVRQAITKELAKLGTYLFSIDSIEAMRFLINNPWVVGYFLENAILRSIVTTGIPCLDIFGPMPQFVFEGFPSYDLTHERALYSPKSFNFPVIDAILLRLSPADKKAELMPMQVTIQKFHRNSEEQFFKNWAFWIRYLHGYELSVTFLWITGDGTFKKTSTKGRLRKSRDGSERVVWPDYDSLYIPLKEVNRDVWGSYEKARDKPTLLLSN